MHHPDLMTREGSGRECPVPALGVGHPRKGHGKLGLAPGEGQSFHGDPACARLGCLMFPRRESPGTRRMAMENSAWPREESRVSTGDRAPTSRQALPPQARRTHGGLAGLAERVVGEALH